MLGCAIDGPSAAGAGRLASRLFFRIELTEVKERAPIGGRSQAQGRSRSGKEARGSGTQETRTESRPASAKPDAKAQKNFTDPDSRIMKSKDGFVQAYNAQPRRGRRSADHRGAGRNIIPPSIIWTGS